MLRRLVAITTTGAVIGVSLLAGPAVAQPKPGSPDRKVEVSAAVHQDVSAPLRQLAKQAPAPNVAQNPKVSVNRPMPDERIDAILATNPGPPVIPDPTGPGDEDMPSVAGNFEGANNDDNFNVLGGRVYPPDTDGDVGPNHYFQIVNLVLKIFDKNGNTVLGPVANNALWSGFGGDCQSTNDGDPIVQYDQFADRWMVSQFSVGGASFHECVAVSVTPDPTGAYYRYSFDYADFPDYPKVGVWPDGYYVTYNMFNAAGTSFLGTKICALERSAMLAGSPATQQCFTLPTEWSLLPSDADGPTPPPANSPNYILGEHWSDQNKLTMYKMAVNWANPASTVLTGPITIGVNPFTWACINVTRGRCVPQSGTAVLLESLGGRTMYRLAYRNFGDHESLVVNHTVAMDGNIGLTAQTGLGWYELRNLGNPTPTVFQQGTSADPNGTTFRWMASMAQDKQGNMALGYSTSSGTTFPGIRYVGRLATDPLNQMPQAESTILNGTGSQTGSAARWGDYSSMHVDPVDDCTFWYTNEYLQTTSTVGWRTRIANFKYPGCTGSATVPGASTVTATPGDQKVDVSFTEAPSGGMPVTGYTVTATPGGATCTTRVGVTPDPLSCSFNGLTNGQEYTFSVVAKNGLGNGTPGVARATPRTVPGAPTAVTGSAGNTKVSVSWAPANNGGAAITKYTVTAAPGGATCTTAGTGCDVTGLSNGQAYTFTVVATNVAGDGPASAASAPVTPQSDAQTATVKTPKKIKPKGKTVLLKTAVTTNAGNKATAKVKVKPKGKKYAKVTISKAGKVTIKTTGKKKLKVTLKLTAPATPQYTAYSYSKTWKVKKKS